MMNGVQTLLNFIITVITHGYNSHSTHFTLLGLPQLAQTRSTFLLSEDIKGALNVYNTLKQGVTFNQHTVGLCNKL